MRDYAIIFIFSVNFFLLNSNNPPIRHYGTWRSRVSTFPACTNASRLTRQLQNHTLLTHKILSFIFPSSCDIFVTIVGLLRHGVTITYLPWSGELAGGRGSATFRNVLFRRRNSQRERAILSGEHSQNQRNLACGHNSTHNAVVLPGSQNASTVDYPLEEHRTRKTSMRLPTMFRFYL